MGRRTLEHPVVTDKAIKGQQGVNVIEQYLLEMGHWWEPPGPIDAGIDGRIQLRDKRTGEPLNRSIGVQSKGYERYTSETDDSFVFTCKPAHIRYWRRAREPVLLICSHPKTREAWFKCVTDWFADPARRETGKVLFDKHADRFDATRAADLLRLASPNEPAAPRQGHAPPEMQLTNLLPILEHPTSIWSAPTDHTRETINAAFTEANAGRASDYILREGYLHSLREPATTPLRHVCDADAATQVDFDEWASSDEARLRRYWTELLRRTLLEQTKGRLRWEPDRHLFFFRAFGLRAHSMKPRGRKREVVTVRRYRDKKSDEQRVAWVRHHAFGPDFIEIAGVWHLAIEPDYVFTSDGDNVHPKAEQFVAKIKGIERQSDLFGHLLMWEHVLAEQASLVEPQAILRFGPLLRVEVPVGLDDAEWGAVDDDASPAGDLLAA